MARARFAEILRLLAIEEVDQGRGHEEFVGQTGEMRLAGGLTVRVLGLAALIEAKERSGRPKDLAALPVLRATLEERSRER